MTVGHGTGILSAGENAPIGVFDSGIGGLSILRALQAELPNGNLIYISDAGHAPYGERNSAHVLARSRALAAHLIGQGVQALVVACNTATAAAIDALRAEYPDLPIVGVEPALKPAALLSRTRRVGVMGHPQHPGQRALCSLASGAGEPGRIYPAALRWTGRRH